MTWIHYTWMSYMSIYVHDICSICVTHCHSVQHIKPEQEMNTEYLAINTTTVISSQIQTFQKCQKNIYNAHNWWTFMYNNNAKTIYLTTKHKNHQQVTFVFGFQP